MAISFYFIFLLCEIRNVFKKAERDYGSGICFVSRISISLQLSIVFTLLMASLYLYMTSVHEVAHVHDFLSLKTQLKQKYSVVDPLYWSRRGRPENIGI